MAAVNGAMEILRSASLGAARPRSRPGAADERLSFGKYRGLRLVDVPLDYLAWCSANLENDAWREAANSVYAWRTAA